MLVGLLSRSDPEIAELFEGPNTTGESLKAHTIGVLDLIQTQLDADPEMAALVRPHLPAIRWAALLHDIGKPIAIENDGHSGNQKKHTMRIVRDRLKQWRVPDREARLIQSLIEDSLTGDAKAGVYAFRRPFDSEAQWQRLDDMHAKVRDIPATEYFTARLLMSFSDAAYYPAVRASTFRETEAGGIRVRGDDRAAELGVVLSDHVPGLPVHAFFERFEGLGRFVPKAALAHRYGCTSPGWGSALGKSCGFESAWLEDYGKRFEHHGLSTRIGVDANIADPAALDARLRDQDPNRALVLIRADDQTALNNLHEVARRHGAATMILCPVELIDPDRTPQIPRSDFYAFDRPNNFDLGGLLNDLSTERLDARTAA